MTKLIHAKPSLYAYYFNYIKEIGLKYGYNIVLHGSLNRDMDLIAIPWQETIGDKFLMLNEIAQLIGGHLMHEDEEFFIKFTKKFHGRECYIININRVINFKYDGMWKEINNHIDPQYYIDISILPTT